MAQKYGNTWWGNCWLKSLTNVDYDNRLPRGASYARRGMVQSIRFDENKIIAQVAGSRPQPYSVTLIIPPFFPDQIEKLMEQIIARPALISKLLNRVLDPEILTISEELGLKVFPQQWTDFKMQCNCPDWAVPCKHLASVIYTISREIDNNPFLVFELHKVKLIDELAKRGISLGEEASLTVSTLEDVLQRKMPKLIKSDIPEHKKIDFSHLQDISESMATILPAAPAFYDRGDFKEKYANEFLSITKRLQRLMTRELTPLSLLGVEKDVTIGRQTNLKISIATSTAEYQIINELRDKKIAAISLDDLEDVLLKIPSSFLKDYQVNVVKMRQALFCAIHLLANGAVIPQLLSTSEKDYFIRWIPAYIDSKTKQIVAELDAQMPDMLVEVHLARKKNAVFLQNQAEILISYFVTRLVHKLSRDTRDDRFLSLFFKDEKLKFNGVGEQELAGGIKSWLDHYMVSKSNFRPVLMIEEEENGHEFTLEIGVEKKNEILSETILLKDILSKNAFLKVRFNILKDMALLSAMIPEISTYINNGATTKIRFHYAAFTPFLMRVVPAVRLLDVKVLLPKSLQELLRPKASIRLTKKQRNENSLLRLDDMLAFDWQVAIGNEMLTPQDFAKLLNKASGLIKFKQRFIYVDESDIEKINKSISQNKQLSSAELLQAALTEEFDSSPIVLTDEVRTLISKLNSQEKVRLPQGVNAELRPYQKRGFSWMYRNARIGFGSIIADDMGLGKTLQVITLIQKLKEDGAFAKRKVIVIAPTGLLFNWQKELERFAPELTNFIYHGTNRNLQDFDADVMLTSYGVLRSDIEILKKIKWQVAIIDEAQNIKNHDTAQSKAVRRLSAKTHIAMSGTPVENRLSEFWSIMDFANKGYLSTIKSFNDIYARPIQMYNDAEKVERFKKVTAPFMLRRMKTDKTIISDLPDKIEENQYATLTKQQLAIYEKTLHLAMNAIEEIDENDREALFKRQGLILQMILALKQICNHPALFLKNGDLKPELSGKVQMLMDVVDSIILNDEKVLIFTQFTEMGKMLVSFIEERTGLQPLFYHGGCSVKERQTMVENFQTNPADKVFILSLKAAGTGLNLTAASHVIHYDLWWNPAVEAQATDRAYRIGQKKNVMVHRFITKNTFEEKINEMIERKKHLADMTIATGENWIGKLSNAELHEIFG